MEASYDAQDPSFHPRCEERTQEKIVACENDRTACPVGRTCSIDAVMIAALD